MKEFKVGDRVAYNQKFGSRYKGEEGVVTEVFDDSTISIRHERESALGTFTSQPFTFRVDLIPKLELTPVAPQHHITNHIGLVVATADRVFPRRSFDTILKSLVEEMGELSTEIAIEQGTKKRAPSPDGVKGEAVDVFIVAVDMLRATWGDKLFTQEFTDKVTSKLAKWEGK